MASHEVSWDPQYSVMVALIGAEVTEPGAFLNKDIYAHNPRTQVLFNL